MTNKDKIINYDALWESAFKCRCNVSWKPSVKQFLINAPEDILRMNEKLENGTWKNGKPRPITITYPTKREGLSIPFKDRIYQRSINDNVLYPEMVKHFTYPNCACQKRKGTSFARNLLKKYLRSFYINHGIEGYVLQIDVMGYYKNMRHGVVKSKFNRYLDDEVYEMVCRVLDEQYAGDIGYNPGSQMVQIAGISVLDNLDHFIKECLHIKYYIRYMDDFLLFHEDAKYLEYCLERIKEQLFEIGFESHPKKTKINKLSKNFRFLGFDYRITDTGKIIMSVNPENVKHERKKLYRMVQKAKRGEISKSKVDECYRSWKNHVSQGNSYQLLNRMDEYYRNLWRDEE